ncbi:ABC transporter family substrate-binding protein [Natronoglycomyces albus]|uniref:ABC transporter family substrate-binding protein n=1 Tax=Natronoglycomyces albus TaxID=2811108 RepID=A0A895XMS3_9ACTN|nr:ABC transporter family substrate-binding protein [Natronoglycomyces albus]QSB04699.1 ABC transporter family substrate-binding protein [Natronoglycomyces albus]
MNIKRKSLSGLAVACAAVLTLTACGGNGNGDSSSDSFGFDDCVDDPNGCNSGERVQGGKVTAVIDSGWTGWNTNRASDRNVYAVQAIGAIYPDTLEFLPDTTPRYNSAIVTGEPELVSEDPLTVKYSLNPDANWGDGTPITYKDFIYNWYSWSGNADHCNQEDCMPASTAWGGNVESIDETGDNEITVTYVDGYANPEWPFQSILSYPAHIIENEGFEDWMDDPDVMGESAVWHSTNVPTWSAGPMKIRDASAGEYVILEPNPEYVGDVEVTLDEVELQVIPDVESIVTELRQGSVNMASPASIDPDQMDNIRSLDGVNYHTGPGPSWTHIDINTNNEFLSDVELRKAVFTAIDVQGMVDRTFGLAVDDQVRKVNHSFSADSPYHFDAYANSTQGTGDHDAARQILADAGYEWDSNDNLLTPEGEQVTFNFRAAVDDTIRSDIAEITQQQLADIGITVALDSIPAGDLGPVLSEGAYDLIVFGWSGSPLFATAPQQQWYTGSGSNFGDLSNEELDAVIEKILTTNDIDEAAAYTNEAIELLVEEAYVLPLVDQPVVIMADENLVNVRDNPSSSNRGLYNIGEWGYADEDAAAASLS